MFTLYSRPGSGSAAVEALLAELDLPFRLEDVPAGPDRQPPQNYLAINPRGEVPSLQLPDNSLMTESAAMMIYLADLYPEKGLAPSLGSERRPAYLRWILYFATAVYTADLRYFYPERYSADGSHSQGVKAQAVIAMQRDFKIFAQWLGDKSYIAGSECSAADIYVCMLISWAPDMAALFAEHPNLQHLYARVARRPKVAAVWQRNEMPLAT